MVRHFIGAICLLALFSCNNAEQTATASNIDSTHNLFNGKDLTGWHTDVPEMDTNALAKSPFAVRDGMLVSLSNPQGHIITDSVYQNYRLRAAAVSF